MYGFSQAFWLNLMTLCTFSVLIHDLALVLKFLCVQNIPFYNSSDHQVFQPFKTFILSGKNGKSLLTLCNFFLNIEYLLQKIVLCNYVNYSFLWNLHKLRCFPTQLKPPTDNFWPSIQIIQVVIHKIWSFFNFIIMFYELVVSFCVWMNSITYRNSGTFFYHQ